GWLDFLGRNDNQVKVRGYRVELSEIESALIKHPEIDQAIVSSLPGTSGETRLVAYMNAASHPPPTITSLRAFLMDSLPDYMLPSKYIWVTDFPKTPTGKIDLRSLPSPDSSRPVLGDDYTPPNTPTEERLASIWSEILNITPVGIHDNYFDLGGNSIQAALIFSRLERIYAKRLPITSLLQAPTVHLLAAVLERAGTTNDWHTVAPLQTGGNKPPLFCLAPRDGGVMVYYDLIKLLGPDQPGYGLLARGLDGHEVPFDRIEDMAAHYIAEIRAIQPVGPYYLVGYSSGGVVAYEMAHQLNDLNQEVALLVMLDAYGVGYPKLLPNTTRWTKDYYRRVERLKGHFFNLSSMNPKEKLDYLNSRAKDRLLNSKNVWVGRWRELFDPVFRRAMKVRQANYQARYHYHPKPYPGKVLLVRASRQHKGIYPDPMLGWGELLTGDFEVFESPGDHYAIMYPPGLLPVADKIRSSLAASQT
ncbi:MAG: alpha/beta fold hydrolase, partial [Anaerolineae bacterium]|nr:alpha/beta fold hydrolase [Anaerolineae bacterium]